jgi:hypothetical protein
MRKRISEPINNPDTLDEIFQLVPGLWGAGRSVRARDGRNCVVPVVSMRGTEVLRGLFLACCARV